MTNEAFDSPTAAYIALALGNVGNLVKAVRWIGTVFCIELTLSVYWYPFFLILIRTFKKLFHSPMLYFFISVWPLPQNLEIRNLTFGFYLIQNSTLLHCLHIFRNLKREWLGNDLSDIPVWFWFTWAMVIPNLKREKMGNVLDISDLCEAKPCDLLPVLVYKTCGPGCVFLDFKFWYYYYIPVTSLPHPAFCDLVYNNIHRTEQLGWFSFSL